VLVQETQSLQVGVAVVSALSSGVVLAHMGLIILLSHQF